MAGVPASHVGEALFGLKHSQASALLKEVEYDPPLRRLQIDAAKLFAAGKIPPGDATTLDLWADAFFCELTGGPWGLDQWRVELQNMNSNDVMIMRQSAKKSQDAAERLRVEVIAYMMGTNLLGRLKGRC
jgi:hypothetical protein